MSALGLLNFVVLQWFGVRLSRVSHNLNAGTVRAIAKRPLRAYELVTTDDVEIVPPETRWTLLRWIWPLTGWWSPYRWIWRRR